MFLDNFRNRYSFNLLAICGWIYFSLFLIFICPEIYITYVIGNTEHFLGIILSFLCIALLSIVIFIIDLFVVAIESLANLKINNKFFKNKIVKKIQFIGFVFAFLPFIISLFLLLI